MDKILVILFILSNFANAQLFGFKKQGLMSTLKYFKLTQKQIDVDQELTKINTVNLKITIGNQEIEFRIAHYDLNPNNPTVLSHIGLDGAIDNPNILYLAKTSKKYIPNVNFIVVDTLSSLSMNKKTCFTTLGGLEDIPLIESTIDYLFNETSLKSSNKEIALMGGSGSSYILFHATKYLNKNLIEKLLKAHLS